VLHIVQQVALALQRASELGLVHRDIKPENILLTRRCEVKVADFGLSRMIQGEEAQRLTQTGTTLGTPLYMSPEQVEGRPLDCRSDIYSLGVTCYHLLAGRPPFEGENAFAVALQHLQHEPPPLQSLRPDLPEDVCALVHRMMAKRPEERFSSPAELLQAVAVLSQRYAQSGPVTASTTLDTSASLSGSSAGTVVLSSAASTLTWQMADTKSRSWRRRLLLFLAVPASLIGAFFGAWQVSRWLPNIRSP
jgi:serine/threonine protein kinase